MWFKSLYFDFFIHRLLHEQELVSELPQLQMSMLDMAYEGRVEPFFQNVAMVLKSLSRRDFQNFDEKQVKTILMSLAIQTNIFFVKSEREYQGGYTDVLFLEHLPYKVKHQYIFELKYLKKKKGEATAYGTKKSQETIIGLYHNRCRVASDKKFTSLGSDCSEK